jgi:Arc/MetJ family transcription regulator
LRRCETATNLAIDDDLICAARELGHHKSKREAVTAALEEYVRRRRQLEIRNVFGTLDWDEDFDYRKARGCP